MKFRLRLSRLELIAMLLAWLTIGQSFISLALGVVGIRGFTSTPYLNFVANVGAMGIFSLIIIRGFLRRGLPELPPLLLILSAATTTLAGMGLVIGLSYHNTPLYVATDTSYLLDWVLGGVAAHVMSEQLSPMDWRRLMENLGKITTISLLFATAALLTLHVQPSAIILKLSIVCICMAIFCREARHWLFIVAAVGLLAVTVTGLNRATIIMLFVAVLVASVAARRAILGFAGVAVAAVVGLLSMQALIALLPTGSQLARRLNETSDLLSHRATLENSMASLQRVYEANVVYNRIDNEGLLAHLFGLGAGATINGRGLPGVNLYTVSLLGLDNLHNIHFLHAAILFRHGVFGLIVLGLYVLAIIWCVIGLRRLSVAADRTMYLLGMAAALYCFSTIAMATTASNFFFADPLFGFCLGWGVVIMARSKARPRRLPARYPYDRVQLRSRQAV